MAENISIEESVLLGMKKKELVAELNIQQYQLKDNNNGLLERLKQALQSNLSNYLEDWSPTSK